MDKKIMFLGASGTGKTTLADYVSKALNIPFINSSYSELIPRTKNMTHEEMLKIDPMTIFADDRLALVKRASQYRTQPQFVADRSYIDSMAYLLFKISKNLTTCDTTEFLGLAETLLFTDCTHLVFLPFERDLLETIEFEDNGKRVTNLWFQYTISSIMNMLLTNYFKMYDVVLVSSIDEGTYTAKITSKSESDDPMIAQNRHINVLVLNTFDLEKRKAYLNDFLNS